MSTDPLTEVRSVRKAISTECGDDPERVFAFYLRHQEESKRLDRFRFVDQLKGAHALSATEVDESNESD